LTYEPRTYRDQIKDKDLTSFTVVYRETDLHIRALKNLEPEALQSIKSCRAPLERYIETHPLFLYTLEPLEVEPDAPAIVKEMADAARIAGVGPMAAVAGAIAEAVGKELIPYSAEVIVENGGDIFLKSSKVRHIGIYAGDSPFTGKITLEIQQEETPLGICTSSKTVGPSLSLGTTDAAIVLARSAAIADAVATAIGNAVKTADDIDGVIKKSLKYKGVKGVIVIKGDKIGIKGNIKLIS
jgi:uncharacterized protein